MHFVSNYIMLHWEVTITWLWRLCKTMVHSNHAGGYLLNDKCMSPKYLQLWLTLLSTRCEQWCRTLWFIFTLLLQHKIALKIMIAALGPSSVVEGFSTNKRLSVTASLSVLSLLQLESRKTGSIFHKSVIHCVYASVHSHLIGIHPRQIIYALLSLQFSKISLKNPVATSQTVQCLLPLQPLEYCGNI